MNDLISRDAAIKHLYGRLIESANNNVGVREDAGIVFEDIATERLKTWVYEIPTAEKAGKLTRHLLKNANVPWGYDCSACGEWFVISEDTAERYNYCPNCGARMEGEENDSDKD